MIYNLDGIATVMTCVNHIPQVSLESFRVIVEQSVDQPKQLHYSLILSQVLVTFQQEHEVLPIASCMYKHNHNAIKSQEHTSVSNQLLEFTNSHAP